MGDGLWQATISKDKYVGKNPRTESAGKHLAHRLKWGTHEWEAYVLITGPNSWLSWTTDTWKKDLPEASITTISYATDMFNLSHPGTYTLTVKLVPVGASVDNTAGKVIAEGSGTFQIPVEMGLK